MPNSSQVVRRRYEHIHLGLIAVCVANVLYECVMSNVYEYPTTDSALITYVMSVGDYTD